MSFKKKKKPCKGEKTSKRRNAFIDCVGAGATCTKAVQIQKTQVYARAVEVNVIIALISSQCC